MSVTPVPWRPLAEHDVTAAQGRLIASLASWQTPWFRHPVWRVGAVELLAPGVTHTWPDDVQVWSWRTPLWCASEPQALQRLTLDALALSGAALAWSGDAWPALLETVKQDLEKDFIAAVGAGLAPGEHAPEFIMGSDLEAPLVLPLGGARFGLTTQGGKPVASILCAAPLLWPVSQPPEMARPRARPALTRRTAALADVPLSIAAVLGQAELTASQLRTLSVGDVIALDRPLAAPVQWVLDASPSGPRVALAEGLPGRTQSATSLHILSFNEPMTP